MRKAFEKILQYSWIGILIFFIPCIIKARVPDSDTFFIAATGRYIVENGIVPTTNPFVIHEGFGMIVQQWLFDVLIYGIYNTFGNLGLFVYVTLIYAASMLLLYKYFGLFTENKKLKNVVLIISSVLYIAYAVARPTGVSFIMMLGLLYCMEKYRRTQKTLYLLVFPIVSLVLINVHAAMWPIMFVLLLPYIFPYTWPTKDNFKENAKKWFNKNKFVLLTMAVMVGVGFVNPNGLKGMTYVLASYGSATGGIEIKELVPPATNELIGIIILIVASLIAVYTYMNKDKLVDKNHDSQYEFTRIYMALGTLVLACMHSRNMWYLILGGAPVILTVLSNFSLRKAKPKKEQPTYALFIKALYSVVLIVAVSAIMFITTDYSELTNKDSQVAPIKAVEYLNEKAPDDLKLYTEFNNGAFLEWHNYKVYMDARPELFQKNINGKEDIYTEYSSVIKGEIDYQEFLNKYNFTHLIVKEHTLFDMYLRQNPSYVAAVDGEDYTLYELK